MCLVEGRTLLIARSQRRNPVVWGLHERLRRNNAAPTVHLFVEDETIMAVYFNSTKAEAMNTDGLGRIEEKLSEAERLFMELVNEGARQRASDLHIDVVGGATHVRFRIDGRLRRKSPPWSYEMGQDVLHLAYLTTDESEGPMLRAGVYQRGRISGEKMSMPPGVQSMRLQFGDLPGKGKFMALRFANASSLTAPDERSLGYADFHVIDLKYMRMRTAGLNCIVGATGSGKSTTLQVALQALGEEREGAAMIMTVEDPPEYTIRGARQLPVHGSGEDRGRALYDAISAALRSDPDVIMIGEVRDKDTAQLAVRAAQTGHGVWTTVHATRAVRALTRLIEEGVPQERLLDPDLVTGLVGQRLVGVLCPTCALGWEDAKDRGRVGSVFIQSLEKLFRDHMGMLREHTRIRRESDWCGERDCNEGYLGRTVVAETVMPDSGYMEAYRDGLPRDAEKYWTTHLGGVRIAEHGLAKMLTGEVDPVDLKNNVGIDDVESERLDRVCELAEQHRMTLEPAWGKGEGSDSAPGLFGDDDMSTSLEAVG